MRRKHLTGKAAPTAGRTRRRRDADLPPVPTFELTARVDTEPNLASETSDKAAEEAAEEAVRRMVEAAYT